MAINKKLIHFKKHSDFIGKNGTNGTTSPTNGYYSNIPANAIVFILDTKQIWSHGQYYNCPYTQDEITALLNNKADISDLNNYLTTKAAESTYLTKTDASKTYLPKGDYITSIPVANDTTSGVVTSGGDVTISNGVITVNDDSHNHVISNIDGLQDALAAKLNVITKNVTYTGDLVGEQVATFEGTTGTIKASGFTIAKSVPSTAVFTDTTSFNISAGATDDDVIVLTGTPGTNGVSYDAKHAKKFSTSDATYTSGNSTTSISGSGGSGTIKVPQITVDSYGHVTAAADESVTITMPSVPVTSVAGKTGAVTLAKTDVGLSNVDNTSDANKPISAATQAALNNKAATSHASTATIYGVGTTANYGHVKISNGDADTVGTADGLAAGMDHTHSLLAPKASPTFTGTPKAPTAAKGTNTTQVATTAFVQKALPTTLKNPNALTIGSQTYDGSSKVTITAADLGLSSALKYHGTTTTALTDGATTKPIVIGGSNHNQEQGCVVAYGKKEFVWTGSAWEELGNEGNYKVVQEAVSSPSASGSEIAFIDTISQDAQGKITATKKNVTFPTLSGGSAAAADATVAGGVTVSGHAVTVAKKTVTAGSGITVSGGADKITIGADLKSTTKSSLTAANMGSTSSRQYAVGLDANGDLSVNVPWSDTTYSSKKAVSGGTDVSLVTTGEKTIWNAKASTDVATTSADGLMSKDDKIKLNGIAAGATANIGTITGIKMNGASKGTSGVVDLGTVITDVSGKLDVSTAATTYLSKTDAASTYLGKTAKAASATTADSATYATSAGNADKLAGYGLNRFILMTGRDYTEMDLNTIGDSQSIFTEIRTSEITTTNSPYYGYGALLSLKDGSGIAKMQFLGSWDSLYFRTQHKAGASITSAWKTIAFTDSNVASATYATSAGNAAAVNGTKIAIVSSIPSSPDSSTLYFVK